MRWGQNGDVRTPGSFIELAEASGLIVDIGWQVIRDAIETVSQWQSNGHGDLTLGINVSSRQLDQGDFVPQLKSCVQETGFDPTSLEIEITEQSLMDNFESTRTIMNELREWGSRVAIDDFGTGYSSFQYILELPVDTLKIDRSFIMQIHQSEDSRKLVESIVEMGQNLELKTLAEGVEKTSQADRLREVGVKDIQGFLYSRPKPASTCLDLLEEGI